MYERNNGVDDVADIHRQIQEEESETDVRSFSRKSGTNLTVSGSDDDSEQQAEAVAQKVVNGEAVTKIASQNTSAINAKYEGEPIAPSDQFASQLNSSKGGGQSLDEVTKGEMEMKMGADFGEVKLHTGNQADELSTGINARAFQHENDIYFKEGHYNPSSAEGKELIAHELVHVVQNDSAPEVINRAVIETDANYSMTLQDFREMHVYNLDGFAEKQTDWYNSDAFSNTNDPTGKNLEQIRKILMYVRQPGHMGPLDQLKVGDLLDHLLVEKTEGAVFAELDEFVKASNSKSAYRPYPTEETVDGAINEGKKYLKFQEQFAKMGADTKVLFTNTKVHEEGDKKDIFEALKTPQDIDDLINYIGSTPTPYFQTKEDFLAFANLNSQKKVKEYQSSNLAGRIRNFHRFEKEALDILIDNFDDTSKTKRLVLMLHTSTDWNGALVANSHLTEAIKTNNKKSENANRQIMVLLLEGFATLSEYSALIPTIAKDYGKDNRLDQVVLIGHGSDHSVELGGSVAVETGPEDGAKPKIVEHTGGAVDFQNNRSETKELFKTILDCMETDEVTKGSKDLDLNSRIVLYACLTNTEDVPDGRTLKNSKMSKALIGRWIKRHKNLIDHIKQTVGDDPAKYNMGSVIGSIASHSPSVKMLNANNTMGLDGGDHDPGISAEDPLEFVKVGLEPEGLTNAVLKCWAAIPKGQKLTESTLFQVMDARAKSVVSNWRAAWIKSAFRIITESEKNFSNTQLIDVIGSVLKSLSTMHKQDSYSALKLNDLQESSILKKEIFKQLVWGLKETQFWTGEEYYYGLQSLIYLAQHDPSAVPEMLVLANSADFSIFHLLNKYFEWDRVKKYFNSGGLLPSTRSKGSIIFAFAGMMKLNDATAKQSCIDYLKTEEANPDAVNCLESLWSDKKSRNIKRVLLGWKEESITDRDKIDSMEVDKEVGNVALFENVEKGGTIKNTLHVTSVSLKKFGNSTQVYSRPEEVAIIDKGIIPVDQIIYVAGEYNDGTTLWYQIEYFYETEKKRGTAFVKQTGVKNKI